ncbi:MAG: S8 family peptidase [Actinomycetota bacterium]|nr:S8 family peptidase [Actinomycetota bacterium]
MSAFMERLARYRSAKETKSGHLFGADLFDAIEEIRRYGRNDRLAPRLAEQLGSGSSAPIAVDIELWHPGDDVELARSWQEMVESSVAQLQGQILDRYVDHARGVVLLRARLGPAGVSALADIDEVATIDTVPQAPPALTSALETGIDDLPLVEPASDDSPLLTVIDSGINPSHPLLSGSVYEAITLLPQFADGADDHGHGTAVAGAATHGAAEDLLINGVIPRPFARILSIRVLDQYNNFPQNELFEHQLERAIRYAAQAGSRVINISIGDASSPLERRRATPAASVIDALARELDLVVVVPTGNIHPRDYVSNDQQGADEYAARLATSPLSVLIDPAPAALAITVGGIGQTAGIPLGERILGVADAPSAITRRGPGVARAIKPELVAPSGTMAWNPTLGFVVRSQLKRILCSHDPTALFRRDIGTSFAAPAVSRVAAAVRAENPTVKSAALTRALVLQSAAPVRLSQTKLPPGQPAEVARHARNLVGHGSPRLDAAIGSSTGRVVLVAEGALPVDFVVLYSVPLPQSFFETGGTRRITLGVSFDPLTRYRRLDYMGSRIYPYLFHGATADAIAGALLQADDQALQGSLGGLRKFRLALDPSSTASSDSANIYGIWERKTRMDPARGDAAILALRSSRRWAPENTQDRIGVALAVEHEGRDVDLHAELTARVQLPVEVTLTI